MIAVGVVLAAASGASPAAAQAPRASPAAKMGAIVGGPTAGTNGDVNSFKLPGDFGVAFTGMKVLKHDGSQHHGIAIRPTVPVSRTRKGVSESKDEILPRGVEVVKAH